MLGYFRPYWRAGLLALACLAAGALLGLVPALVILDHHRLYEHQFRAEPAMT